MTGPAIAACVSFTVTIALVPLIRRFCERAQILDKPGLLKIHARPVPRLGGVAIFLSIVAGIIVSGSGGPTARYFVASLSLIWFAGLVDDLRGLHPAIRLTAQIVAGMLLWRGGWHLPFLPGGPEGFIAVCVVVVLFVNAFNFLDGSDGLAAGVACVAALAYAVLPGTALTHVGFAVAYSMAAACVAFLFFNFYPASIFLGDSGSTVLGFATAVLGLDLARTPDAASHAMLFPFLVAALPLLDAMRIIARRLKMGRSAFHGDRCHFYDLLLIRGWKPRKVALVSWSVACVGGAAGVFFVRQGLSDVWSLIILALVGMWIARTAQWPQQKSLITGQEEKSVPASQ
jgi:UDP-GlcNAc:undecaprenyl-phosphate GlcNAc-1-phosphate transferase